jgi:hypothetical protein
MKKYIYGSLLLGGFFLTSCKKQFDSVQPLSLINSTGQLSSLAGILQATSGNYLNLLNGGTPVQAYIQGYTYEFAWNIISETRGNNVLAVGAQNSVRLTDAYSYTNSGITGFSPLFWRSSYQLIVSVNTVLEGIAAFVTSDQYKSMSQTGQQEVLHAEGENYFLRALAYFNLVRVYGMPYYQNPSTDLGVPLKLTSLSTDLPARSSVAETYQQVVHDLQLASSLMTGTGTEPNTFANVGAAQALMSRVYLYMGGTFGSPDNQFNQLAITYADSVISSGTYSLTQGQAYVDMFGFDSAGTLGRATNVNSIPEFIFADDHSSGTGGINPYYTIRGSLSPVVAYFLASPSFYDSLSASDLRQNFLHKDRYGYIETTKYEVLPSNNYSYAPTVYLRLAEVYLNRAEAEAKMGSEDAAALADLNVIHTRAGLPALTGLTGSGLFNAILNERRLELAFEGDCGYDYFRNGLAMTRPTSDTGGSPFTVEATDNKVVMQIPFADITAQPNLVQNPQ